MTVEQTDREFPLQNKELRSIPWAMIAEHEAQALKNHGGQSLKTLARRGGLSAMEAVDVLSDKRWDGSCFILPAQREAYDRCEAEAVAELRGRIERWRSEGGEPL